MRFGSTCHLPRSAAVYWTPLKSTTSSWYTGFGRFLRSHTLWSSCLGVNWSRHWFTPNLTGERLDVWERDVHKQILTSGDLDRFLCSDEYQHCMSPLTHSRTVAGHTELRIWTKSDSPSQSQSPQSSRLWWACHGRKPSPEDPSPEVGNRWAQTSCNDNR